MMKLLLPLTGESNSINYSLQVIPIHGYTCLLLDMFYYYV
jgi:hypothetical protein